MSQEKQTVKIVLWVLAVLAALTIAYALLQTGGGEKTPESEEANPELTAPEEDSGSASDAGAADVDNVDVDNIAETEAEVVEASSEVVEAEPVDYWDIDEALIAYEQIAGPYDTRMEESSAIAVDAQGRVMVAGDRKVTMLGRLESESGVITLTGGPASFSVGGNPTSIGVSSSGLMYIGMGDHVEVYDNGRQVGRWQSAGADAVLTSIAVADDFVFVADAGNRLVRKYDLQGSETERFGEEPGEKSFVLPSAYFDVAMGEDGLLYAADTGNHQLEAWTSQGYREFAWGKAGMAVEKFCGCCNPANFATLPDGGFVTSEKGIPRIKVYNALGKFEAVVAGPKELGRSKQQTGPCDVAVDSMGRIYVLDPAANTVCVYDKKEGE